MLGLPSPVTAAANHFDATLRGGIADTRRMPSALIAAHETPPKRRGRRRAAAGVA